MTEQTKDEYYSDERWGSSLFFKFDTDGSEISGTIVDASWKHFDATDNNDQRASDAPVWHLEPFGGGDAVEVTLSYADLKTQVKKTGAWIGDKVKITRIRKVGNKILFDLKVQPGTGVPAQSAPAESEFPF